MAQRKAMTSSTAAAVPLQRDPITGRWLLPKTQKFSMGEGNMSAGAGYAGGGPACGGHG
jgi:hypothetical protein